MLTSLLHLISGFPNTMIGNCVAMSYAGGMRGKWVSIDCDFTIANVFCKQGTNNGSFS
jgi:hypothetical protein